MCFRLMKRRTDTKVLIISAPSGAGKQPLSTTSQCRPAAHVLCIGNQPETKGQRGRRKGILFHLIGRVPEEDQERENSSSGRRSTEDHYYGTLRSEIERITGEGQNAPL